MTRVQAPNATLHGPDASALPLWWRRGVTFTDNERALQRFRQHGVYGLTAAPEDGPERLAWLTEHASWIEAVNAMRAEADATGRRPSASALQDDADAPRFNYQTGQ